MRKCSHEAREGNKHLLPLKSQRVSPGLLHSHTLRPRGDLHSEPRYVRYVTCTQREPSEPGAKSQSTPAEKLLATRRFRLLLEQTRVSHTLRFMYSNWLPPSSPNQPQPHTYHHFLKNHADTLSEQRGSAHSQSLASYEVHGVRMRPTLRGGIVAELSLYNYIQLL